MPNLMVCNITEALLQKWVGLHNPQCQESMLIHNTTRQLSQHLVNDFTWHPETNELDIVMPA